jgi:hypothetical protein
MKVLKYRLHEGLNTLTTPGTSKLVYLDYQDNKLMGWVLELEGPHQDEYEVFIALTGQQVPLEYNYVTSTQTQISGGYYVVHAFD